MSASHWTRRDFLRALGIGAAAAVDSRLQDRVPKLCTEPQAAEHRPHHVRRHGLLRPRLLRRARSARRTSTAWPPNGLRFTQFYNTARCCPTRASLLTGLYPHQAGIGHMTGRPGLPRLPRRPERRLRHHRRGAAARRATAPTCAASGTSRSHIRHGRPARHNWPLQRGFDRFYGTITGAGSFYDPTTLCRDNTYITPENDPEYKPETYYYTDAISDNAVRFIREHAQSSRRDKPFFMYVAYTAAHWPMHALEKDIAKYRGKYDAGYEPCRAGALRAAQEAGPDRRRLGAVARRRATGTRSSTRSGKPAAWRSTRP